MTPSTILTCRSSTRGVTIESSPTEVFDFLADPENLPRWAVGFCRSIRREGERWFVVTPNGEVAIRLESDRTLGVIDFYIASAPGVEAAAFSRLVPNGSGAEYVFTLFQTDGMPDHVFEGQVRTLSEELLVLRGVIHARASCRA